MKTFINTFSFFSVFIFTFVHSQVNNRLPGHVIPMHYDLTVNTNFNESVFKGDVSIIIKALETTNTIRLHSRDLNVTNVHLFDEVLSVTTNSVLQQTDFLDISFINSLVVNRTYVLSMEFSASLRSDGMGFYKTSYTDAENNTRYLAVTHFESTFARFAFPCFDEPNLKATFQISLVREAAYSTVSNMKLAATFPFFDDPSKTIDVYDISPKLPTYLVAYAVLDLPKVSNDAHSVYGRKELLDRGDERYGLITGIKAVEIMKNLTSIENLVTKLDQIAVPNRNYNFDETENLGMIAYRERNLMYNELNLTAGEKQNIGMIIARAVAYQWFGNLVTPQWWKYIWLSEGFATYYATVLIDMLEPDWFALQQFIVSVMQSALEADALDSSNPLTRDAETPTEIKALYDTISSNKAASVIRMTLMLLGETVFRSGIRSYLAKWSFDNVEPNYLYQSWQEALGNTTLNVTQILETWETQAGYPVVTVTRDYDSNTTTLSQKRFRLNTNSTDNCTKWIIPVNWFSSNTDSNGVLLLSNDTILTVNMSAEDWLVINYKREGFYRVNYDEINWILLTNALLSNLSSFPVQNRAQFIDDAFNLARARLLDYHVAFEIGKYITEEEKYVPIAAFTNAIGYLDRITRGTVHNSNIREYGLQILENIYEKIGFEFLATDTHMKKIIRTNVLMSLCDLGHNECSEKSLDAFRAWSNDGIELQQETQAIILCNALRNRTNSGDWATILIAYFDSQDDNERSRMASTLGCIDYDTFLISNLNIILITELDMNTIDRFIILKSVLSNNGVRGVSLILDYLTNNFTAIDVIIGNTPTIIKDVAGRITTENLLNQFKIFVETNDQYFSSSLKTIVSTAMADAEYNLQWLDDVSSQFDSYFSNVTPDPGDDGGGIDKIMPSIAALLFSYLIILLNY